MHRAELVLRTFQQKNFEADERLGEIRDKLNSGSATGLRQVRRTTSLRSWIQLLAILSQMANTGDHAKRPPRVLQKDDACIFVRHAPHMESQVLEWKP